MNYGYKIEYFSDTQVTREANPEDSWDGEDLDTSWTITPNISESDETSPDIVVPFKLDLDKNYYIVHVIYSTGDSFHHHSGYQCDFIELFQNKEKAETLVKAIKEQNYDYYSNKRDFGENAYILPYKDEKGNEKTLYCKWNGYFESIDVCEALTVNLQLGKKNKIKYKK